MSMESPSSLFRFPGSEPVIRHSVNGAQHGASDQEHYQFDETREFTQSSFHFREHIKDLIAIENSHSSSTIRASTSRTFFLTEQYGIASHSSLWSLIDEPFVRELQYH
jgi:hypothetical protein